MSHRKPARASGNAVLASIRDARFQTVLGAMTPVELETGEMLTHPDGTCPYVYFPVTAVLSLLTPMEDGMHVGAALVGNEGFAPVAPFHDVDATTERIAVHVPGSAARLSTPLFRQALAAFPELRAASHRFSHALLTAIAHGSACERRHSVDERCARWILATHDRAPDDEFPLTHDRLAEKLGVRRASVSVAAERFRSAGMIDYRRGRLRVVDRAKLVESACGCYAIMRKASERILGERVEGRG